MFKRVPIRVSINLLDPEVVETTNEVDKNHCDQNQTNDRVDLTNGDGGHDALGTGVASHKKLQILLELVHVENLENSRKSNHSDEFNDQDVVPDKVLQRKRSYPVEKQPA